MNQVTVRGGSRLEAILKIRRELGSEAVIVEERRLPAPGLPGILGKRVYEVTAEPPTLQAAEAAQDTLSLADLHDELEELRQVVTGLQEQRAVVMAPASPERAHKSWRRLGVTPDDIGEAGDRSPTPDTLASMLPAGGEFEVGTVALVGSAGVGKTTAAANLAARFSGRVDRVALLALGAHRGSTERLRAVAAMVDAPLVSAETVDDLPRAAEALEGARMVFMDTPPLHPREGVLFEELKLALEELGARRALVLSAAAKPKDVLRTLEFASGLAPERVIFTQLDCTADLGGMLTAGARWGIPISYVCDGPKVPGDIRPAVTDELVALALERAA